MLTYTMTPLPIYIYIHNHVTLYMQIPKISYAQWPNPRRLDKQTLTPIHRICWSGQCITHFTNPSCRQ